MKKILDAEPGALTQKQLHELFNELQTAPVHRLADLSDELTYEQILCLEKEWVTQTCVGVKLQTRRYIKNMTDQYNIDACFVVYVACKTLQNAAALPGYDAFIEHEILLYKNSIRNIKFLRDSIATKHTNE